MTDIFLTKILPASDFTNAESRTRVEQVSIKDRWVYTDHFEDHPKGIKCFDAFLTSASKPRGRGGVKRIEFTTFETMVMEEMQDGKPVREIANNHGLTWSECQKIVSKIRSRIAMREWRARQ